MFWHLVSALIAAAFTTTPLALALIVGEGRRDRARLSVLEAS